MPAIFGAGTPVTLQILGLLPGRELWCFARIDADIDDVEIISNVDPQFLERLDQTVVDQSAQHRTVIIAEHEQHRFALEMQPELKLSSVGVTKNQIARDLLSDVLIKSDLGLFVRRTRRLSSRRISELRPTNQCAWEFHGGGDGIDRASCGRACMS